MSVQPTSLPAGVKDLLDEVLRRKLSDVSPRLYPAITIDDILLNVKTKIFPFATDSTRPEPRPSATLAGILANMGAIRTTIDDLRVPKDPKNPTAIDMFNLWDADVLLSFFCANIELSNGIGRYNFNGSFKETRARLFKAVQAQYEGKATELQKRYIKACLEENDYPAFRVAGQSPTMYRERFILALQQNPTDFKIFSQNAINGIQKSQAKMLARFQEFQRSGSSSHASLITLGNTLNSLFARPAGRQVGTKLAPRSTEPIHFDTSGFTNYVLERNPLLFALLKADKGFHPVSGIQITEEVESFSYNDIAGALADIEPTNDDERYDHDYKFWGKKEFNIMANSFDFT